MIKLYNVEILVSRTTMENGEMVNTNRMVLSVSVKRKDMQLF